MTDFQTVSFNDSGVLGYEADWDNWGLRITESGRYRFELVGLQDDYDLRLLTLEGTEIESSLGRGQRSETIVVDLEPGDYLLEVSGYDGAFSTEDEYRLLGVRVGR